MSSPSAPSFLLSSPLHSRPSRFTYRHLQLLRSYSTRSPLRVIAHIDLDAFYAQCEMVRLNTPRDQPLAVQQWDSLIAVNYPARPFGISRMITAQEARKRCPQLITQHVATFREGEGGKWTYREDNDHNVQTDKVSLDPYRAESRKIFQAMRGALLDWAESIDQRGCGEGKSETQQYESMVRIEKAGIDEVFIDLSAMIYATLMERYPMLHEGEGLDKKNVNESLPHPPTTALEWRVEDELVDLDTDETEEDDPDWDDVAMLIGADIVRSVRRTVWERLKYTCSGGIARNKMISKLGSACNKPNKQTIVRNRAVQQFLGGFKFTKIRMLGGKLGKQIAEAFATEQVSELLDVPMEQFRAKLDDDTGTWLYELIRGNEYSEVSPRTQIKSMLSAKSFRPSINSTEQGERWLRILVADIYGRLVEDGVLENKRRPKVVTLHHRTNGQTRSRQIPIPSGRPIDENALFDFSKALLEQAVNDGHVWPCANLSLAVSGFEEAVSGNKSLDSFFARAGTKNPLLDTAPISELENAGKAPPNKRRKATNNGIQRFFTPASRSTNGNEPTSDAINPAEREIEKHPADQCNAVDEEALFLPQSAILNESAAAGYSHEDDTSIWQSEEAFATYTCSHCAKTVLEVERGEHDDWHFAKDIASQERAYIDRGDTRTRQRGGGRGRGRGKGDKRQTQLAFW